MDIRVLDPNVVELNDDGLRLVRVNDIIVYTPPSGVYGPFAAWVVDVDVLDDPTLVQFWRWMDGEWKRVVGTVRNCEVIGSLDIEDF